MSRDRYPTPARRRVPTDWLPLRWEDVAPWYQELEERPLADAAALEAWLLDRSEIDSLVSAVATRHTVAAARNTADREAERRHLEYQERVIPEVKKVSDRLDRRFLGCSARAGLDPHQWEVYVREAELAARLYREENVALEAEEEKLATEYGRISGGMTVEFRGRTLTLPALAPYLEEPDRATREESWRAGVGRRLQDHETLEELFDRMLALRAEIARNAGFENYRDYKHQELGRFDYAPEDCLALHRNIERHVLPVIARMDARRRELLGLRVLRPWDTAVDPSGLPPFQPFRDQAEQVAVSASILDRVDPDFGADLRWMEEQELLDLDTRAHKRPGGFMETFEDQRWPFIFSNSSPTHDGVQTVLHESGHAVHALLSREREPLGYRMAPIEFCEVASMGMEAMALEHLDAVYPGAEARRAWRDELEGIPSSLSWIATIDAFQHWLYTHEGHDREQRRAAWEGLLSRFQPGIDWSGLEAERAWRWQAQLHLYEVPFYYVEYALAQIGALQLWSAYRRDPRAAVGAYRRGLALGGSRPLPELYAAAGLHFDPRGEGLGALMAELEAVWESLCREEGAPA